MFETRLFMKEYHRIENDDGSIVESYWHDGKKHREDGPAEIERRADGTVIESYWQMVSGTTLAASAARH
jgi:hypothetical protein